jgi:putative phosphoesterase
MRLGIISDIHSNLLALEACLTTLRGSGVDAIFDLGDTAFGSLEPRETLDLLLAEGIRSVRGNQDRVLAETPDSLLGDADLETVKNVLSSQHLEYLKSLPITLELDGVLLCHGTPSNDETCLLEKITPEGVSLEAEGVILDRLVGVKQPLILCGHSHISRTVWLEDGRLVVNPGSVGMPAYDHGLPYPHVMQSGSPHARCAVLTRSRRGWDVQHLSITYDWEAAAHKAFERGRPDRASWLRSGRAQLPGK